MPQQNDPMQMAVLKLQERASNPNSEFDYGKKYRFDMLLPK